MNLLLTFHLLVWIIHILIRGIYPMRNVYFMKACHQKSRSSKVWKKSYHDAVLVSFTATPPVITTATNTGEQISSTFSSKSKGFTTKLHSSFGVTYRKFWHVGMKRQELKAKQDCSFWPSAKLHKWFSKINDSVKSSLKKWKISHPRVILSPIINDYITVKFDDGNGGVKT